MKTCPNCRQLHDDEYNGTCPGCGKNMATVDGSDPMANVRMLESRWRNQGPGVRTPEAVGFEGAPRDRVDAVRSIIFGGEAA